MAKKTYEVKTALRLGSKEAIEEVEVGAVVELDEKVGTSLVAAGALVEQLTAEKKSDKKPAGN